MRRMRTTLFPFSTGRSTAVLLFRLPLVVVLTAATLLRELVRPQSALRPLLLRLVRSMVASGAKTRGERGPAQQSKMVDKEVRARYKVKNERVL